MQLRVFSPFLQGEMSFMTVGERSRFLEGSNFFRVAPHLSCQMWTI